VLAGTVAAQVHLRSALGPDLEGPPAQAIDVIVLDDGVLPERIAGIPIRRVDALGFDASIRARRTEVDVDGLVLPIAAPEHVLGTTLAGERLSTEGRWASFALLRALEGRRGVDLEEVRGFLKRCADPEREQLLHELAYLAA